MGIYFMEGKELMRQNMIRIELDACVAECAGFGVHHGHKILLVVASLGQQSQEGCYVIPRNLNRQMHLSMHHCIGEPGNLG